MIVNHVVVIVFGLVLGIVHYYSTPLIDKFFKHKMKIISFGAGIFITYIFLILLPELYRGVVHIERLIFIYILIGFVMFHVLEKYLYQHVRKDKLLQQLKEAHSITFFIYHFIIGIVLAKISENLFEGAMFFVPILFYTAFSEESLSEIHESVTERRMIKLFLSASTFFGVIFEINTHIPEPIFYSLIAFVSGALLYIIIRESIPKEKRGMPMYFIVGCAVYIIIIMIYWYLFS